MSKLITADYAASLIKDEMVVGVGGFVGFGTPEELLIAIEKRYTETGQPMNLTAFHSPAIRLNALLFRREYAAIYFGPPEAENRD